MKKNTRFTEGYQKKLSDILLADAMYTYVFDVTTGIIEDDIVSKDGMNYTKAYGLTSPCLFDEIIRRSFSKKYLQVEYTLDSSVHELSCAELSHAFETDKRRIEAKVYLADNHRYHRLTYLLDCDGEKPQMKASPKMYELLGIELGSMSEEVYDFWYAGIKKSSLPTVQASVSEMIEKGISENTYVWNHPKLGEIYVRCGGTAQYVEGKGYVLRGYHSDVTDIINSDMKQKQLLADALEEAQKQKSLLQEAFDNYKQADYDRRTDFLTGLRNRQDMFELLQDTLSGKRDSIRAMFMMDIDNFKLLNDNYGHMYGDECLKKIGKSLTDYGKKHNIYFYRYGGEELLGISFGNEKPENEIAKELVPLVSDLQIKREDVESGVVTISLGYTTNNRDYEKMIDLADTAMYRAKANGKNQAVCFEEIDVL